MKLGAIEGGGTKFVCGIGSADGHIIDSISIPTTTPEQTLGHVMQYFAPHNVQSIGFGSFGPVGTDSNKANYGRILNTPKPHWSGFPMLSYLKTQLHVPIAIDTDVNAAALGEATWGAAAGLDSCMYMTVGTGIGAGAIMKGKIVQGFSHSEMGHLLIRRHPDDHFPGACPFHGDCLEGMAAGPALEKRYGKKAALLDKEDKLWEIEAYYLAQALVNIAFVLSPKKVILGGGVMKQAQLFPYIREHVKQLMQSYLELPEDWIVAPKLGEFSALKGALALARAKIE
ncbi:ROK family protein [Cohnella panacarvi]|uniref:ROK family protein n=1 Tax=Cohnella panacarvi TaxID=400776 RepID=UPI000479926D|nr:ROK family protein [Cohnella panacarvi]